MFSILLVFDSIPGGECGCLEIQECVSMEEVGREAYFAKKIGLLNIGLDPSKDCNHVSNDELKYYFGERKQHIGYNFRDCRSQLVKARVIELYPVVFQVADITELTHLPESFARALVSEVCHNNQMNWAKYAEDRWGKGKKEKLERGKAKISKDPIVFYRGDENHCTYFTKIDERPGEQVMAAEEKWRITSAEHSKLIEVVKTLTEATQVQLDVSEKEKVKIEISCLRESLGVAHLQFEKR